MFKLKKDNRYSVIVSDTLHTLITIHTSKHTTLWKISFKKHSKPFGGKYDLDSALWGQSTTSAPNLLKAVVISSENDSDEKRH